MPALGDPTLDVIAARNEQELQARLERQAAAERAAVAPPPSPSQTQVPTGIVARALGALSGTPVPATTNAPLVTPPAEPPEQPSPRNDLPDAEKYRRESGARSASYATRALLDAHAEEGTPVVEGQPTVLSNVAGAVGNVVGPIVEGALKPPRNLPPPKVEPAKAAPAKKDELPATTIVSSDDPAAPATSGTLAKFTPKGAPGGAQASATGGRTRDQLPDAVPKAAISPTYLVDLEKSNPALHDGIIQAASAAGIGSWDYANLIYASSKGDPNYNAGGRVGLAGLSQQDIDRYQKIHPEMFRDSQGNPVTAQDPHTSLMLGALKYAEMRANYGAKTPMSILAYHLGQEKVDALARVNSPAQQQAMLPPNANQLVQQSISGPDAGKPYVAPTPVTLTPPGTATPMATYQAAAQAARTGNALPFIAYGINALPRGMGSNDGWRYLENQMVSTMIAAGDMDGAQKARELVFQMSHVGANQALMSAYKLMSMGDYHGSAQQMALAYWAAPDGGVAQFMVGKGKDGKPMMLGQRYNEDTHSPVGAPFEVNKERLIDMMNVTRDPNAFAKILRDNQKLHADIAEKEADTALKGAHADYYKNLLPSLERRAEGTQDAAALAAASRALTAGAKGANKPTPVDPRVAHVDKLVHDAYAKIDLTTNQEIPPSPEEAFERSIVHSMRLHNDSMEISQGRSVANDLVKNRGGGVYEVQPNTKKPGWAVVYNKRTGAVFGELDPYTARLFVKPASDTKPAAGAAPARQPAPGLAGAPSAGG